MSEIITVGLDLAKNVFQVHGADASGLGVLRKKLRRDQVLAFFSELRPCLVAMEACGGAHFWGREIGKLGREVRLIPPAYVEPFVKRQKNDAADAEAICEAAMRPTMRFVPVKSEETQGAAMVFRIRELLIRQRTQAINALRGHLGEFGQIVPQGAANAARLIAIVEDPESGLPAAATATLKVLVEALTHLETEIGKLDAEITRRAKENEVARRLMTIPGIGPLIATAIAVLAPPPETFRKARIFAAWLGLTPRQHSTGGKQRLGATTRMGERSLRRLLIIGANAAIIDQKLWDEAHEVIANNRVARGAVARAAQPALLCGLIFTETGAAMTPHHTKRKGKRYCYYTSMDVIRKRPAAELRGPQRLPGDMVEEAVIGEIRRMLRTPEVAARTALAVRKDRPDLDETTVVAALAQFDDLWKALIPAEQARIVQLLVARITVSETGLAIDLRHDGLGAIAAVMAPPKKEVA